MKRGALFAGIVAALGCETLFGLSYPFVKVATGVASPMTLLGWRFLLAFLLMQALVFAGCAKVSFRGKPIGRFLLLAALFPVADFVCETFAVHLTTAAESGTIIAFAPAAYLVAETLRSRACPSKRQVFGILLAVAGVIACTLAKGCSANFSPVGYALLFLAIAISAFYCIMSDRLAVFSAFEKTYLNLLVGAVAFGGCALVEHGFAGTTSGLLRLPFESRAFLLSVGVLAAGCSVGGLFLYNRALGSIGTGGMACFVPWCTVVSVGVGVVCLGESFGLAQVVGAAAILAGVVVSSSSLGKGQANGRRGVRRDDEDGTFGKIGRQEETT